MTQLIIIYLLLDKLAHYWARGIENNWLKTYLTYRKKMLHWMVKHSLQNPCDKCTSNKMPRQFQNFSVCLGHMSAKKPAKVSAETFMLAIASTYLSILPRAMIWFLIIEPICSTKIILFTYNILEQVKRKTIFLL